MSGKISQPNPDFVQTTANIANVIRTKIREQLPAPAEQFFTMMIPGKVVNFQDFTDGMDEAGESTTIVKPDSVQLAEAILCDDMPALGAVQLGPTGRSVARSYNATLSKLCPAGSTVGIDDMQTANTDPRSIRYRKAMDWLTGEEPSIPGKKRVELYREKQKAYTEAYEQKVKAFDEALKLTSRDPRYVTLSQQKQAYSEWVKENQKTYRNLCQAAYMDWVTIGKKEEVEYWFSIVDNDSAMSRVEASKEAMRNSVISDLDGAVEYQKVTLDPSNWAWLALQKATSGSPDFEAMAVKIEKLKKINSVIKAMLASGNPSGTQPTENGAAVAPVEDTLAKDPKAKAYGEALVNARKAEEDHKKAKLNDPDDPKVKELDEAHKTALTKLKEAQEDLLKTPSTTDAQLAEAAKKADNSLATVFTAREGDLRFQLESNEKLITEYQTQLDQYVSDASAINKALGDATGVGAIGSIRKPGKPSTASMDPWTKIYISSSESKSATSSTKSSTSASASAQASFGLWSVGGSVSHTSSRADVSSEMASSECDISFECMRVDIHRGWLRPELFYDHDLVPASGKGNEISPGPVRLACALDPDSYVPPKDLKPLLPDDVKRDYGLFPMYPTAFLLAANVVLKFTNASTAIKSHFDASSTSASASVSYGPFSVSASGSHSDENISSSAHVQGNSVTVIIKSPQIIGWVSEMLPALPRPDQV